MLAIPSWLKEKKNENESQCLNVVYIFLKMLKIVYQLPIYKSNVSFIIFTYEL